MSRNAEVIRLILTLQQVPGVGTKTIQKALKGKSLSKINSSYNFAKSLNINKVNKVDKDMWNYDLQNSQRTMIKAAKNHIHMIPYVSSLYPRNLRTVASQQYPLMLYAKGSLKPLQSKSVAIVGSRQLSPFSKNVTSKLAQYFSKKHFATVAGLALGTDTVTHKNTIASGGHTIAVLAEGLDQPIAPQQNTNLAKDILKSGGTLVSTYPLGTPARGFQFAARDKWQSGISNGVVATKAGLHSGTSNTMRDALRQGRILGMPDYKFYGQVKHQPNLAKSSEDTQRYLDKGIGVPLTTSKSIQGFAKWMNDNYKMNTVNLQKYHNTIPVKPAIFPKETIQNKTNRISAKVNAASKPYKRHAPINLTKSVNGNIFNSKAQTIVNTVNTRGAMGKGLALQFKNKYPQMYKQYRSLCKQHKIQIGKPWLYKPKDKTKHWVLNFPTKANWWDKSKLSYVDKGLQNLQQTYKKQGITSIAIPPLGSGLGGLDYKNQVKPLMDKYLSKMNIPTYEYSSFKPSLTHSQNQSVDNFKSHYWHGKKNVYFVDGNNRLQKQLTSFKLIPGFNRSAQKQSSINLRKAFNKQYPQAKPIEISSVSNIKAGRDASALNLQVYAKVKDPIDKDKTPKMHHYSVEQLFQAGKIFKNNKGQTYQKTGVLHAPAKYIKYDMRSTRKDKLVGFKLFGHKFPMTPKNYYYDSLYKYGLIQHPQLAKQLSKYNAFTDVWATKNTMNTQAKTCALVKSAINTYGNNYKKALVNPNIFMKMEKQSDYQMSHPFKAPASRKTSYNFKSYSHDQDSAKNDPDLKNYTTEALSQVFTGAEDRIDTASDDKKVKKLSGKNKDVFFLDGQPTVLQHNKDNTMSVPSDALKAWKNHTSSSEQKDTTYNKSNNSKPKDKLKKKLTTQKPKKHISHKQGPSIN